MIGLASCAVTDEQTLFDLAVQLLPKLLRDQCVCFATEDAQVLD